MKDRTGIKLDGKKLGTEVFNHLTYNLVKGRKMPNYKEWEDEYDKGSHFYNICLGVVLICVVAILLSIIIIPWFSFINALLTFFSAIGTLITCWIIYRIRKIYLLSKYKTWKQKEFESLKKQNTDEVS